MPALPHWVEAVRIEAQTSKKAIRINKGLDFLFQLTTVIYHFNKSNRNRLANVDKMRRVFTDRKRLTSKIRQRVLRINIYNRNVALSRMPSSSRWSFRRHGP